MRSGYRGLSWVFALVLLLSVFLANFPGTKGGPFDAAEGSCPCCCFFLRLYVIVNIFLSFIFLVGIDMQRSEAKTSAEDGSQCSGNHPQVFLG